MNLFDKLFAQAQPQQAAAPQQQQQPQQQQMPVTPAGNPNMQVPGVNAPQPGDGFSQPGTVSPTGTPPQGSQSHLDTFKDLWQANKDGEQDVNPMDAPIWTTDVNDPAILASIQGMSFVDQQQAGELLQKGLGGDVNAMVQVMNMVGQAVFRQSMAMNANMSSEAAKVAMTRMSAAAPQQVRKSSAEQELFALNPALQHPAVQDHARTVAAQIAQRNPTFTPTQVAKQTAEYFAAIGQVATTGNPNQPSNQVSNQQPQTGSADFSAIFRH